jgi:hypothetical protein
MSVGDPVTPAERAEKSLGLFHEWVSSTCGWCKLKSYASCYCSLTQGWPGQMVGKKNPPGLRAPSIVVCSGKWPGQLLSKTRKISRVPVAYPCNPSYSGSIDQETQGLRTATPHSLAKSSQDPISKIPNTKEGWCTG